MPPTVTRLRRPQRVTNHSATEMYELLYGTLPTGFTAPATMRNTLGLAGAWIAVNRIGNNVALMLTEAEVSGIEQRPQVVAWPTTEYDPFTFWKLIVTAALCRGNALGIPYDPGADGWPTQVLPVHPDSWTAYYDPAGYLVYDVAGQLLSAEEVVHIRLGVTIPGEPLTIGVIEAHRTGLEGMLAQQGMAKSIWREGAVPSGVVQLDTAYPTTDQATAAKANWQSIHNGRRTVAVIGSAMNYTPITWSAKDAEFLESRQYSVAEAALMFGLRPEDIGASLGASSGAISYGNRAADTLQRITDSYTPIALPIELVWSWRLLPEGVSMRASAEALMRSTVRERYELHQLAQAIGLETPAETREAEGRPAITTTTEEA